MKLSKRKKKQTTSFLCDFPQGKTVLCVLLLLGAIGIFHSGQGEYLEVTASDLLGQMQGSIAGSTNKANRSLSSSSPEATVATKTTSFTIENVAICDTSSKGWEAIFESLLGILFREEGVLPSEGAVLDVGAQFGEQACHFAILAPNREVIAMDPSPSQVQKIKDSPFFKKLNNLHVVQGGIGANRSSHVITDEDINMKGGGGFTGLAVGDTFEIETVDHMFHEKGKLLAFAHIDVEGRELDTLRGAQQTIRANHPVFTTEVRVHRDPTYTRALLDFIDSLGYDSFVIDEVCGFPHMDFRNLLNIPRSLSGKLAMSDTFTFAMASETIWRVDSKTIFETVLPCCALGGECCPVSDPNDKACCAQQTVHRWMRKNPINRPIATIGWQKSRRTTINRWNELIQRGKLAHP